MKANSMKMKDVSLNKSVCKRRNCMSFHQYFQNRSKSWLFLATLNQGTLFQSGQKQFITAAKAYD